MREQTSKGMNSERGRGWSIGMDGYTTAIGQKDDQKKVLGLSLFPRRKHEKVSVERDLDFVNKESAMNKGPS